MDPYLRSYNELNPRQREAVDATDGAVLVLAGPGTGKTQLLSVRAGSIIRNAKARPDNILILTYTNSAAGAMKERLASVIGQAGYDIDVGTFHSFANSIIQDSAEAANYVGDRIPMSDVEQAKAIEFALDNTAGVEDIRPFRSPYTYLKEIQRKISDMKKDDITPDALDRYLADPTSAYHRLDEKYVGRLRKLAVIYRRYEELKSGSDRRIFDDRGRYDFDDMILFAVQALRNEKGLLDDFRSQYTHLMVDEFQDTNGSQLDLLFELMGPEHPNLCCVGDDDQSIYRFQGANVMNFDRLMAHLPLIKTIKLEENYRSTEDLIGVSRKIIDMIPAEKRVAIKNLRQVKKDRAIEIAYYEFTTEEEELLFIVDKVKAIAGLIAGDKAIDPALRRVPYNNIAVLVRKRDQILRIIDSFLQAGIPYATDGKEDIASEMRVRQLLDVCDLASIDPKETESIDLALYRVLTADYFCIEHTDILRLIHHFNQRRKSEDGPSTILEMLLEYFSSPSSKTPRPHLQLKNTDLIKAAIHTIKALIEGSGNMSVHKLLLDYIDRAGIYRHILREYADNSTLRIRQLRSMGSFVNMVKSSDLSNPAMRLGDLMAEFSTRKNHSLPIQGELVTLTQAGVRIYTAHGSKGLEFHSVIMPFCLQNKSWPIKPMAERIPLPGDLFSSGGKLRDKEESRRLSHQDETRLFYVATTRAKSSLIFTASPGDDNVQASYIDSIGVGRALPKEEGRGEEAVIGASLAVSGREDPFIGTEEVLSDMISNMTLNPTRLNSYIRCRRKFLYNDVLKLPGHKKKSLIFGNCVHKALEETYRRFGDTRKFPSFTFFAREFAKELRYQGVDKAMETDCLNRMKTLRSFYEAASKDPVIPIGLEKRLVVTVGENIIFTGKYDKVEWDDRLAKTVRVIDYKTGKPDDHIKAIESCSDLASPDCEGYLRQLVAYRLLYEKDVSQSRGRRVSAGSLVFVEPLTSDIRKLGLKKGEYVTRTIPISDEMVASLEEVIKSAWRDIKSLRFEKLPEEDADICGNCDFNNICWG